MVLGSINSLLALARYTYEFFYERSGAPAHLLFALFVAYYTLFPYSEEMLGTCYIAR